MSCVTIAAESDETPLSAERRKALKPSACMSRGPGDGGGLGTGLVDTWGKARREDVE